jgi:septum site-determining protein MinD
VQKSIIRDKRIDCLHLLPAAQTRDKTAVTPEAMEKICAELRDMFDFTIIDSPAGIEQGFQNAVVGADEIVVITTPHVSAIRDADRVIGLVEAAEKQQISLVVNRLQPEMVRRGEMLDIPDMLDILSIPPLGIIPEDESIVTTSNKGELATQMEKSLAGQAYKNIARRMLGEEVPFMSLDSSDGFLQWLKRLLKL